MLVRLEANLVGSEEIFEEIFINEFDLKSVEDVEALIDWLQEKSTIANQVSKGIRVAVIDVEKELREYIADAYREDFLDSFLDSLTDLA